MKSGNYYGYLSGVKDRGRCTLLDKEPDETRLLSRRKGLNSMLFWQKPTSLHIP